MPARRRGPALCPGLIAALLLFQVAPAAAAPAGRPPPREQAAPADGPNQGPGFALPGPVALTAVVHEDAPPSALAQLGAVAGLTVVVSLRGNMLRDSALPILRRLPRAAVILRRPLLAAHVEQLRRVPRLAIELEAGATPLDEATVLRLGQLGPRRITVRVDAAAGLTDELLAPLGRLRHGRIRAVFGKRAPGPEELHALRRASGDAEVELDAAAPPEAVRAVLGAGLAVLVRAAEDRLPRQLLAELGSGNRPVAVELSAMPASSDVERLGRIPRLASLVLRLDGAPAPPPGLAARLTALRPGPLSP